MGSDYRWIGRPRGLFEGCFIRKDGTVTDVGFHELAFDPDIEEAFRNGVEKRRRALRARPDAPRGAVLDEDQIRDIEGQR